MLRAIDNLELAERTAIGEAIFSCLDAIKTFQRSCRARDPSEGNAPARIVLMSDGSNTWGRSPEQAVGAAKQPRSRSPRSRSAPTPATSTWRGSGSWCRSTTRSSRRSRTAPAAATTRRPRPSELSNVYRDLGSQIGYTTERREITTWFVGIGLLFAFGAAGVSLLWSNRLL